MKNQAGRSFGLVAGTALLALLTGCETDDNRPQAGYLSRPAVQAVVYQDDYDYYPGYETYYSRSRHEYVYRNGNNWVRSAQPRGISVDVLLAAPSVRVDFHDSPEPHHGSVVQSYPRNWQPPQRKAEVQVDRRDDKKDAKPAPKKNEQKKDRNDENQDDHNDDRKDERKN